MKKGEGIYNVIVIGAGTAGLVTAAGTAGLGGRVALIERNLMGGDCRTVRSLSAQSGQRINLRSSCLIATANHPSMLEADLRQN